MKVTRDHRPQALYFDTIGCRLNQSEIEMMARQARALGKRLVHSAAEADWIILNSCTVTSGADSETRRRIKRAHQQNPDAGIAVTGCWATLHEARARALPGVRRVIANEQKSNLIPALFGEAEHVFELEPVERKPIPGIRMRTRAFIKAQDGCNHSCAYCLTTVARGSASSLPIQQVVDQVQAAVEGGAKEAVISGVQLSAYGRDLSDGADLSGLVRAILADTDIRRLRLSSLEPWGLPGDFFELWDDRRMCRQLHLPLQAGSRGTLKRMQRPMTPQKYKQLVTSARAAIPGLAVTTDLLTGFPGETQAEFNETIEFVESIGFSDAHVFPFSARPNTPAIDMPNQVPSRIAKSRAKTLRALVAASGRRFRQRFLGSTATVLWESAESLGPGGWRMGGLSDNYLRVVAHTDKDQWNQLSRVRLQSIADDRVQGVVVAE